MSTPPCLYHTDKLFELNILSHKRPSFEGEATHHETCLRRFCLVKGPSLSPLSVHGVSTGCARISRALVAKFRPGGPVPSYQPGRGRRRNYSFRQLYRVIQASSHTSIEGLLFYIYDVRDVPVTAFVRGEWSLDTSAISVPDGLSRVFLIFIIQKAIGATSTDSYAPHADLHVIRNSIHSPGDRLWNEDSRWG